MSDDPSIPPAQPVSPAPLSPDPVPSSPATSTGMEPNLAAALSVILTFITGIIFLLIEKRSQFVRFWAMQATVFGLIMLAVGIALGVLTVVVMASSTLVFLLVQVSRIINLATFIIVVFMAYQAYNNKEWELPIIGKIARQQLAKFPPKP